MQNISPDNVKNSYTRLNLAKLRQLKLSLPSGAISQIAAKCGMSKQTAYNHLNTLREAYNVAVIEAAIAIYNERTMGDHITIDSLK